MIKEAIKILLVENDPADQQLMVYQIQKIIEHLDIKHATNFEEFSNQLVSYKPDIIISDYSLNDNQSGMDILNYTMKFAPHTYFIFVTGTINDEEIAANTILNGASGYILKKHMSIMSEKLLPHFESITKSKNAMPNSLQSNDFVADIKQYIEVALKNNKKHLESYNEIKATLDKLKNNLQ